MSRRQVIALNAVDHGLIPQIRAANPDVIVLMYKDMSSTRNGPENVQGGQDVKPLPTGVGYIEAQSHPTWFLKDAAGQRIEWQGWPNHWMMDIGLPAYQARWLANVEADLALYGFDGVWIDNNLMTLRCWVV